MEVGNESYSKWLADAVADLGGYMLRLNTKSTYNYLLKPHPHLFTEVFMRINPNRTSPQTTKNHTEQQGGVF